ncbi:MAG: ribonuclease HI family protein [Fimbriimonadia bacterium]|jgi:ribonuclease HI/probable phosphoglycerate mutase
MNAERFQATLFTDGASKGNPGPASIGVLLQNAKGNALAKISERIGIATNNEAEYAALIRGLKEAKRLGLRRIRWHTDSQLLHRQWIGRYRVRSPRLQKLYAQAKLLAAQFDAVLPEHVHRTKNTKADALANAAFHC